MNQSRRRCRTVGRHRARCKYPLDSVPAFDDSPAIVEARQHERVWSFRHFRSNRETNDARMRKIRDALASSSKLLRSISVPDTFVGRKTHEPFPEEDEELRIER